ncbi:MAG TPA: Uma2 family endonuclease [Methylothermaceae bacterium]|nr:Uma2 family endonuclease [Methylothermaceae bacterium]
MAEAAKRRATYEDLCRVPDHLVAEIIDGELIVHPRPAPKHAHAASSLGIEVGSPFGKGRGGPGGWWILDEPEVHLGPDVVVPDLAGWRRENLPRLPESAWFDLRPDWVCEVLSPATYKTDRRRKMPLYARHQVPHLWLIDPESRTLEAYRLQDGQWLLLQTFADQDEVAAEPFDAVPFELGSLWAD